MLSGLPGAVGKRAFGLGRHLALLDKRAPTKGVFKGTILKSKGRFLTELLSALRDLKLCFPI